MFAPPRYLQSTFTLVLPELRDISGREKQIYERLRPQYFPAQSVRMPNIGDSETPWLAFSSQHGHSQILVGSSSVVLNVIYSQEWQTKISDARQYIHDRMRLVFDAAETFDDIPLLFCGSVMRARLQSSAGDEELVQAIAEAFVKGPRTGPYHDLVIRTTTLVDDLFFNNISIQNYRTWNPGPVQSSTLRLSRAQAVERGVEIVGDFNSRYAFNEDKDFPVTREAAGIIIDRNIASVTEAALALGGGRR